MCSDLLCIWLLNSSQQIRLRLQKTEQFVLFAANICRKYFWVRKQNKEQVKIALMYNS